LGEIYVELELTHDDFIVRYKDIRFSLKKITEMSSLQDNDKLFSSICQLYDNVETFVSYVDELTAFIDSYVISIKEKLHASKAILSIFEACFDQRLSFKSSIMEEIYDCYNIVNSFYRTFCLFPEEPSFFVRRIEKDKDEIILKMTNDHFAVVLDGMIYFNLDDFQKWVECDEGRIKDEISSYYGEYDLFIEAYEKLKRNVDNYIRRLPMEIDNYENWIHRCSWYR